MSIDTSLAKRLQLITSRNISPSLLTAFALTAISWYIGRWATEQSSAGLYTALLLTLAAIAFIVFRKPTYAFPIIVLLLPLEGVRLRGSFTALKLVALEVSVCWFIYLCVHRKFTPQFPLEAIFAFAMAFLSAASALWATFPSFVYLEAQSYFLNGFLIVLAASVLRSVSDIMIAARFLVYSTIVSAAVAFMQMLSLFSPTSELYSEGARARGFTNDPNFFAMYQLIGFCFLLAFVINSKTTRARLAWLLALGFVGASILLTSSRAGVVSLVIAVSIFMALSKDKSKWWAMVVLTISAAVASPLFWDRLTGRVLLVTVDKVPIERFTYIWPIAFKQFLESPIIGIGASNFAPGAIASEIAVVKVVHNTYLSVLVELGMVGETILIGFLVVVILRLLALAKSIWPSMAKYGRSFSHSLLAAVAATIFMLLFFSAESNKPLWILGAFTAALWGTLRSDKFKLGRH